MNKEYREELAETDDYEDRADYIRELECLIGCYQIASRDDRNVVWAALNKYVPSLTLL